MIPVLGILCLLGAAVLAVGTVSSWLDRRIPSGTLIGFLLLSVLPYPQAFVTNVTPLPLDHVKLIRPWADGSPAPYNPYLNDITTQILPWTKAVRQAWKDGALPLRNQWNGCGMPLAANSVSAAFWPLTFVGLLLPLWRAFTLTCSVKLLLAAAGMWLWTRELGSSVRAAGFAAVAYALSFTFLPPWIFYPQSGVFCLWPWMLFLIERCRDDRGRTRAATALSGVFVLTVLAGHPESAAMGLLFAGLWLSARWLSGDLADGAKLARPIALAAGGAVLLSAFLLIPSALAIGASARLAAVALPFWQPHLSIAPHAPQWRGILPPFFPHTLGNGVGSPTVPGGTGTFCEMAMGYAGILCWVAVLLVLRPGSRRPRAERVLWGLLICGFGVAVCMWPFAELFAHVPGIRYVFPLRFNGWVALAGPAIAAMELDRYARDAPTTRMAPVGIAVSSAVFAGCGIALYLYLVGLRRETGGLQFQTWQLGVIVLVLALSAVLAFLTRLRPEVTIAGMTVLCGAELLYQWHGVNRLYSPALMYPQTPLVRFLHAQPGTFRVTGQSYTLFPNTNVFAGLQDIRTHEAVERRDYMAFLDRTCGYAYGDYFKMLRNVNAPALDFLNVRFLVADPHAAPPGEHWREVYSGADGTVFENSRVLARSFAPSRIRRIRAPAAHLWPVLDAEAAFGGAFSAIVALEDWSEKAYVLASDDDEMENPSIAISGYAESTNSATFEARVAEGGGPGFAVLSLVQDGGWSASEAGGTPLRTFLANGPFLAVQLPPGAHQVNLRYSPPGFRVGSAVSLASLGLFAAAFARRRILKRK